MTMATRRGLDLRASLALAIRAAGRADLRARRAFGTAFEIRNKSDGTPVTTVDREIEATVRDLIDEADPGVGVLGEEYPEKPGRDRWVIDPIDGTQQLIDGDPRFAFLMALERRGEPVVGVVSAPVLGIRWWAAEGLGAFCSIDGTISPARVSVTERPTGARGLWAGGAERGEPWLDLVGSGMIEVPGNASWEAVRVATGEFDLAVTEGCWWDVAPMPIIVREAGGHSARVDTGAGRVRVTLGNGLLAPAPTPAPTSSG